MTVRAWFRKLFARPVTRPIKAPPRFRPALDALEDRLTPSTLGTTALQAVRPDEGRAAANPFRRRFDRVTVGFWLGAIVLGTAGLIIGARMPYRHPVAVGVSVAWWALYCGCLGASLGA